MVKHTPVFDLKKIADNQATYIGSPNE